MNLPNLITLARLLSVPVAVWLIVTEQMAAAFWVFVAAGLSDAVDGFVARRFDAGTELGAYLDPLADKALLASVYISLGLSRSLPIWLVILVVFRDLLIVGGRLLTHVMIDSPPKPAPLLISKINTGAQIALAALVLARLGLGVDAGRVVDLLIPAVAATTVYSGARYVVIWLRSMAAA